MKTLIATTLAAVLLSSAAFAQATAPATTAPKAPAVTAPAVTAPKAPAAAAPAPAAPKAATTAPAPAAVATAVNLNTASETELDKLDQIGPARAKAIVEARTKGGRFKNWEDFVARNVVPKNAEDAIKGKVRF